jgi:diguanylate cyclase (GGDEF)-like protein
MAVQNSNVVDLSPGSQQFSRQLRKFLSVDDGTLALVRRYRSALLDAIAHYPSVSHAHLLQFEPSAEGLSKLQQAGENPQAIAAQQASYLEALLDADEICAPLLTLAGAQHYEQNIKPQWILASYYQYIDQLTTLTALCPGIADVDRPALSTALSKLVLTDMGLMLQGHWHNATSELLAQNQRVTQLQQQVSSLLANIPQVLWSVDVLTNRPLYVSPSIHDICPTDTQMPIPCLAWTDPEDRPQVQAAWETAMGGQPAEVESRVRNANHEVRWFRRLFRPFTDDSGTVVRIDGIMEETTDTHAAMERLETLATIDTLTQLANRTLWHDRLGQAINAAKRSGDHRVVLMIVDLNHFKLINDTLGHPTGDTILRETAKRLKTALREADTLARLGGDEFGVLLPNHVSPWSAARSVAEKILGCFKRPFGNVDEELFISAAIGIAMYPDDGETVSSLVSHAEIAMYRAKRENIGFHFYQPGTDHHKVAQLQLVSQLHHALEDQEFELYYQPKIDLNRQRLCGAEALLRWRHPQLGLLGPDRFIPLAEQIGLITPITEWVLNTALQQQRDWLRSGQDIPVSVNVSALSFQNPKLLEKVKNALHWSGVAPSSLEIEITENTLLTGINHCSDTVSALSQLGVRIAIDDFGTGYSSLSYLRQLPIDTLKIDKSFVQNMADNHSDAVIVRSIIDLGHNLGFAVVAEGVETDQLCESLRGMQCDIVQGFFTGKPMNHSELSHWLHETPWAAGWH